MSLAEATAAELVVEGGSEPIGRARDTMRRLRRNPAAIAGAVLILIFVSVAVFAPWIAPYDPYQTNRSIVSPGNYPGPSGEHWLGVDDLGRDVLSRIIHGARYSLVIGIVSLLLGLVVGALLGGLAGAFGGWVDNALMRITDIMLAVPGLLFAIAVAAVLGRSLTSVMIAIAVVNVPVFARLLRGAMLANRESDYVLAARSVGVKRSRITLQHVIPNSLSPVLVQGTLALATAIIDAAGLAYLGLGSADPAIPEWGRMLASTQRYLASAPQLAIFPGVAIVISVLGFNLLGEALREALDPKLRR